MRILLVCLLSAACSEGTPGTRLASGIAHQITVAPGAAAFLLDAVHPDDRSVPEDLLAGDLWVAGLDKSAAQKAGAGVPTSAGSFAFSRSGDALAYLAAWRFRAGQGELWIWTAASGPQKIAAEASVFEWAPAASALAFIAPGRVGILKAGLRETLAVPIEGAQSFAWAPDGQHLAVRASAAAGGKLWLIDAQGGAKKEVAAATSDFAFAHDGALGALGPPSRKGGDRELLMLEPGAAEPVKLARATSFAFSPDGHEVALLSTEKSPGEATGELSRLPRAGGAPLVVGQRVSDWRWTPSGDLLFLANYDVRARAGVLTLAPAGGGAPRELARKVQSFVAQGKRVLYLVQAPQKGDYKIELWTAGLDQSQQSQQSPGAAPRKIDEGVYGYQLSNDGATLFWKARCAGTARSCSLLREPVESTQAATRPTFLAPNVAGFDLSPDGKKILLEQPHRGATRAVDLAVIDAMGAPPEHVKPFALEADASSRFADAKGSRVVYATLTAGKGSVYLADVP
jgi:hypothetical protein